MGGANSDGAVGRGGRGKPGRRAIEVTFASDWAVEELPPSAEGFGL